MRCKDCGLDVNFCDNCGREFKNQSDIVHYIRKYGKNKNVYHICLSCLNKMMINKKESE